MLVTREGFEVVWPGFHVILNPPVAKHEEPGLRDHCAGYAHNEDEVEDFRLDADLRVMTP